jgi:CheY-like chemotaxis protein
MNERHKVFIVDDQAGEIRSLIRRIKSRGYEVELATNERDARAGLSQIAADPRPYAAGIFDIMVAIVDLETLLQMGDEVDLAKEILEPSTDTGIRLCQYAREDLQLDEKTFPIAALSVRDDTELRQALQAFGVTLYERGAEDHSERSIMRFVKHHLPQRGAPGTGSV